MEATLIPRLTRLWWTTLPLAVRRLSYTLAGGLTDGYYLISFPRLAGALSPLALVTGLLVGWQAPGFDFVVFESLLLVGLLVVLGSLSGHLGLLTTIGFTVGNFFLYYDELTTPSVLRTTLPDTVDHLLWFRVPLLLVYLLMGMLTVLLPLLAKGLTAQVVIGPRRVRAVAAIVLHAAVSGGFVYLWSQSYPVMIRPLFTWGGGNPRLEVIEPVQTNGLLLAAIALAAAILRLVIQLVTMSSPVRRARQDLYADGLLAAGPARSLHQASWPPLRAVASAALLTFLVSGAFSGWVDAAIIGGLALALALVRNGVPPLPLGPLAGVVTRVPGLIRFVIGLVVVTLFARWVIGDRMEHLGNFRPVLVVTAFALVLFFLLNPAPSSGTEDRP